MPFDHGSFSFTMFDLPGELPENLVELFAAAKAGSLDGISGEPEIGWVTGRHLLDTAIDAESCDLGGSYYLMLRQAVRKIPGALLTAICRREELAWMRANQQEFISGKVRREIREEMIEKHLQKMPPALSGIPMVLEPHSRRLYVGATSQTQIDLFIDNFYRVTGVEPVQIMPGELLEQLGFGTSATFPALNAGAGATGGEPCIGRDFLLYLWFYGETTGKLSHPDLGEFDLMIEGPLVFAGDGEERGSAEAVIKKGGSPLRSAEAKAALLIGKKLKKAKLTLTRDNQIWSGSFDADNFCFGSFRLPEGEAMNEYERFAERVENLGVFRDALTAYFKLFAEAMISDRLPETERSIKTWAREREAI